MNKRIKLIIGVLAVIIISVLLNGCSIGSRNQEQDDGIINEDELMEEQTDENIDTVDMVKLPDFNLKDLEGNRVSNRIFEDYDITIVNIWQSTCGPCIEELRALKVVYEEHKDDGVNVLGISLDDVEIIGEEALRELLETMKIEYTNLIADDDYLMELSKYVQGTPTTFIVDSQGELLMEARVVTRGMENDIEDFRNIIKSIQE
ncbi:MAG TPA: TlpA family protein disulfide reductase [Tepidimicrobium sp.]|nr:TlpA family protein disulfide reductase [Tepidimicrobium sp.]